MATVDSLDIQISVSAERAAKSLDSLSKSLETLYKNMAKMGDSVNKNFSGLNNDIGKVKNIVSNVSVSTTKLNSTFSKLKVTNNQLSQSVKTLAKRFVSLYAVVQGGKKLWSSIEKSMNYVETLNYFNAAFGQVAQKAAGLWEQAGYDSAESYFNSFAERAKELTSKMTGFTISESGMLQSSGGKSLGIDPNQLMNYQAMFAQMSSSMGIASEYSLKLSNALTEIGADLASVRNMKFDKVWTDMASGLAGMSRTLDKYGVNIRNANLQQRLNEIGINASISALNQNQKALLRTIILLDGTRYAWGDLSRTLDKPANQLRLLQANFNNLARTIGNIFLPIVAKVLPYVNMLVQALQRLAQWVASLLGFEGFDWGGIGSGASDILSDIYDNADDVSGALDGVAASAKKAVKGLRAFDELNVISMPDTSGAAAGLGGGIDTGLLEGALDKILEEYQAAWDKAFDSMEERFNTFADNVSKAFKQGGLYGVGEYFSTSLANALNNIPWESIYEGARNFGKGLADFLNGLISPELFGAVGQTIAGALNTKIQFALSFGQTFDFKNLGESIASGINNFFATYDFASLAQTLNVWVQGIWDSIKTAIANIEWDTVWDGVKEFFKTLDFETVEIILGALVIKKIASLHIVSSALSLIGTTLSHKIAQALASKLGVTIAADAGIGTALMAGLQQAASSISGLTLLDIGTVFGAGTFLEKIVFLGEMLAGVASIIGGLFIAVKNFIAMWTDGFSWINELLMVIGTALAAVGAVILGVAAAPAAIAAAIVAAVATVAIVVHDNWETIKGWFASAGEWINTTVIQPVVEFFRGAWEKISGFFVNLWNDISSIWQSVSGWFSETVIEPVVGFFSGLFTRVQQIFEGLWIIVQAVWKIASEWFSEHVITPVVSGFQFAWEKISGFFSSLWEKVKSIWSVVSGWFNTTVIVPVTNFFQGLWSKVKEIFSSLWNSVKSIWQSVSTWFSNTVITPVKNAFKTAIDAISGFFSGLWSGIKKGVAAAMNAVIGGIENAVNFMINGINGIISGFNKVVSWAAGVIGVNWGGVDLIANVHLGRIPELAIGGIVNSDTLARIGEAGKEAVVPLTNAAAMRELADAISVPLVANLNAKIANMPNYTMAEMPTAYQPSYSAVSAQINGYSGGSSFGGSSSSEIRDLMYRAVYDAVSAGMNNSKILKDIEEDIQKGHTIEVDRRVLGRTVQDEAYDHFRRTGRPYFAG